MDSQQQFCLKWNSFGSNLATAFSNLFKSETLADVTLFCEGVTFKAHKLILAACSKHLADLFETAPLHQNLLVILDGTSAANMSALLEFMYKGEVHVSQDALSSFLKAAECLQVKGLSIEHEKLAVAQNMANMESTPLGSPTSRKHAKLSNSSGKDQDGDPSSLQQQQQQTAPSPSSYSPAMSPYMHPHHYRQYEPRMPQTAAAYESPRKHRLLHSPSELAMQESVRASVLRDGSKSGRPGSPTPMSLAYRPSSSSSSSLPPQPEADAPPEHKFDPDANAGAATTVPFDRTAAVEESNCVDHNKSTPSDLSCPEGKHRFLFKLPLESMIPADFSRALKMYTKDLRMKMEPVQEEPMSTVTGSSTSNGSVVPLTYDPDKSDLIPANLWNSVGKLGHKAGSVNTPDGKKLKCPFCERLYGYETNLRAHIRQRHQGIRVPCPFCSRTFTRNNTVRRHIAREHKTELSLKAFQQTQQVHNHNQ